MDPCKGMGLNSAESEVIWTWNQCSNRGSLTGIRSYPCMDPGTHVEAVVVVHPG